MRNRKCRICDQVTRPTTEVGTTSGEIVVCGNCHGILQDLAPEVEGGGRAAYELDLRRFRRTGLSIRDYLTHAV